MTRDVVVVTGAGSGIGAAACRRLARDGLSLVVHSGRDRDAAAAVARDCAPAVARVVIGDLADPATTGALVTASTALGRLCGVVANAGFADRRTVAELDDAALARSLDVMVVGLARLLRASAAPLSASVAAGGRGRFVAVGSFVARRVVPGTAGFAATAAAKAGVEALVRTGAAELASAGVTVNAVAPGHVAKDAGRAGALTNAERAAVATTIPLGRLATPDDVACAIAFLLGDSASYITGQVLRVDGGLAS